MMGIKEYARHRGRLGLPGATAAAVRAAIKTGRLAISLTADHKKIQSATQADAEWAATTNADRVPLTGPTAPANTPPSAAPAPAVDGEAAPPEAAPPVNELAAARARREAAGAELAEIALAQKRGELVRARDMEAHMADVFLRCRTRILGVVPRLREQDPTVTAAQLDLIDALIREALEELASGRGT
jgi:hypothetical protein